MATVPSIVVFNDMPPVDEFWLNSGYPGIELMEKSAQAFDKATSDCMVSGYTFNRLRGQSTRYLTGKASQIPLCLPVIPRNFTYMFLLQYYLIL